MERSSAASLLVSWAAASRRRLPTPVCQGGSGGEEGAAVFPRALRVAGHSQGGPNTAEVAVTPHGRKMGQEG